jgi:hypothetical protein
MSGLLCWSAALLFWVAPAAAHPTLSTSAVLKVEPSGRVSVAIQHDVLAFALDDTSQNVPDQAMYELLGSTDAVLSQTLQDARERFASSFALSADGRPLPVQIAEFPTLVAVRAWQREHPGRRLPIKMDILAAADLPPGTRTITVRFPTVLDEAILVVDRPAVEPASLPLRPGETSPAIDVGPPAAPGERPASPAGALAVLWRYIRMGFTHIIPRGADHALFVLGLFLLSPRARQLLWQITAFTVAHTVTLTLAALHLVTVPSRIVEPLIALTIAFVAIENLFITKPRPWRAAVAFGFGLIHGLGFASALGEVGLPTGQLVAGLVGFSIGVECGHVAVLGTAFLTLGWSTRRAWYRRRLAIPLSVVIATIALFWIAQRILPPKGPPPGRPRSAALLPRSASFSRARPR